MAAQHLQEQIWPQGSITTETVFCKHREHDKFGLSVFLELFITSEEVTAALEVSLLSLHSPAEAEFGGEDLGEKFDISGVSRAGLGRWRKS